MDAFFNLLEDIYIKNNYPPNLIYNVDESGLTIVQSKLPQIIGHRWKRQITALTSAERGSLVTIVVCMNATSHFVPPFIICPRKKYDCLTNERMSAIISRSCTSSGWIQMKIFTDWLKHFIQHTYSTLESKVVLILDEHHSHLRNIDIIDIARK